jgi:hypothetical protein
MQLHSLQKGHLSMQSYIDQKRSIADRLRIPLQYWTDIFESVTFIINRLPSSALSFNTPFQQLFQKQPDYQFFRVLGCRCYPYTKHYSPHKLSQIDTLCIHWLFLDLQRL